MVFFVSAIIMLDHRYTLTLFTLCEIEMMRFMNEITDKPQWYKKVRRLRPVDHPSHLSNLTVPSHRRCSTLQSPRNGNRNYSIHLLP